MNFESKNILWHSCPFFFVVVKIHSQYSHPKFNRRQIADHHRQKKIANLCDNCSFFNGLVHTHNNSVGNHQIVIFVIIIKFLPTAKKSPRRVVLCACVCVCIRRARKIVVFVLIFFCLCRIDNKLLARVGESAPWPVCRKLIKTRTKQLL